MPVLEARGVGVAFAASTPILQDVSFALGPGFCGLVGANGAGKTTLLRVLAGALAPHEGAVHARPRDAVRALCPQEVGERSPDVRALAIGDDGLAAELRGRLALDPSTLERWPTLSPGERKRWQIGAALWRAPDVLLLDEPTNHLDADARLRLLDALARFRGVGVIVTHDREVLERLPRTILRVHDGTVTAYDGPWSSARAAWEQARRQREEAHARARDDVRALERRLDAARRTQEAAARAVGARARMKGRADHDGRSMGRKVLASWAEARAGDVTRVVRAELSRAREKVPAIGRDPTSGGAVFATFERAPHAVLFRVDAPELRAGERVVLRDVRLDVGRADRVRVTGPNGAGKTTLLRALVESRPTERVLWLPQELEADEVRALARALHGLDADQRGAVLQIFGALGSDPARLLARREQDRAALSPGEARKLALALGLGRHAWALVLDEPTNHLDLPTIERLEGALGAYPGCVVVVTHDDAFARTTTTREIRLEGGAVR